MPRCILFAGTAYPGSNSGAIARALSRQGALVHLVDHRNFVPMVNSRKRLMRAVHFLLHRLFVREYNNKLVREIQLLQPDLVLVYKGESVEPRSLHLARKMGIRCFNDFPDVSAFTHGPRLPRCLPLYDHVFTTKSFGVRDFEHHFHLKQISYLPHGFDPEIHRPLSSRGRLADRFQADASFIGTWSPKKESFLAAVMPRNPGINLRIWGSQWEKARTPCLQPHIVGRDIMGVLYPLAIESSRVNIAILSEVRHGASSGDQTTARTFEIPACRGFMLHERTEELASFFDDGREVASFSSPEELAEQVHYYLNHEVNRERILQAGHARCVRENSADARAAVILETLESFLEPASPCRLPAEA